ncbi:glycoside hydrolase family 5 protein [Pseudomonas matsuisoli]|uniref:Glycoside hydrolase family 5 domain-containing protein n=1 Tax=Pseudomonas matsuisoli TaxID=1515666 RepID=A0A917UXS6_9PSED|nr:glycoside hydrolase family 5 protein [Pseudomonas matsuisoli]GGJ95979.1 hypothetical protein GCM10009304_22380 [Pseudomonas matsuisoli]
MNLVKRLGISLGLLMAIPAVAQEAPPQLISINVAGAGFAGHVLPGKVGTNFFFPKDGYFAKWSDRGIKTVRFSFKWERLQPKAMGEFDPGYAALIDKALDQAGANGIHVLLDIHNYGRYYGDIVGDKVPMDAYRNLMERIALRWGNNPAVYAYDIMNEPHGGADKYWFEMAQTGIDAIRKYDRKNTLYIEGRRYSSAYHWPKYNDDLLNLKDPSDNIVYSAHMYVDQNSSGLYKEAIGEGSYMPDPMVGVNRLKPFVEWLERNGKRGHIGEFGLPGDHPRWLEILENTLTYLQQNCIPVSYWAAGEYWGKNYPVSIEPEKDGKDKPQWLIMKKYLGTGGCSAIGPKKVADKGTDSGKETSGPVNPTNPGKPETPASTSPAQPISSSKPATPVVTAPSVPNDSTETPPASNDANAEVPTAQPVASAPTATTPATNRSSAGQATSGSSGPTGPQWNGQREWAGKDAPAYQTIGSQ